MTVIGNKQLMRNILLIEKLVQEVKKHKPNCSDDEALSLVLLILKFREFQDKV